MNKLTIQGKTNLLGVEVPKIYGGFGDGEKVMLAKTIAELHGRETKHVNELINKNRDKFIDGVHLIDLKNNKESAVVLTDSEIMTQNAINASTNIYLLSQRGYVRLLKIMDDDTAWEKWDIIENEYFELKEKQTALPQMSSTQIIAAIAQAAAEQEQQIKQITATQLKQADDLQNIRDVVALNPNDWRKDTSNLITKMARNMGSLDHISDLRKESYGALDNRMGVSVNMRLVNLRRRMAENGECVSKRNKANILDVIALDKKLIEGYLAVIKDMAIKYGA